MLENCMNIMNLKIIAFSGVVIFIYSTADMSFLLQVPPVLTNNNQVTL